MSDPIRVILVDDHALVRSGLAALLELEPDLCLVAAVGSGEEAVERTAALRPDVVVMDLDMPGIGGLEATRQIAALQCGAKVIVLTAHHESEHLLPALQAGSSGFITKASAHEELVRAIRVTGRDEAFLSTAGTSILVHAFQVVGEEPPAGPLDALSSREREVLTLTAEGYSASEVGQRLFLSPKTVETYRSRLMHKLGLNHRAELVHFAISRHLLDDAPAESAPVRPRQHARPPS